MKQSDALVIYIDGASSGNPGDAAVGIVIKDKSLAFEERIYKYLGKTTNNVAEYSALLTALRRAINLGAKRIQIRTDSELLVKQINGEYRVRNENLKKLNCCILELMKRFQVVNITHIKREENKQADKLAKKAILEHRRANRMVAS